MFEAAFCVLNYCRVHCRFLGRRSAPLWQASRLACRKSVSRLKLRGSRLVDAELGLLGLVARSETNWAEGMGRVLAGLAARTEGG